MSGRIDIIFDDGHAHHTVEIAAEFTEWQSVPLGLDSGTRYAAIFDGAETGKTYQYKFIVDGHWKLLPGHPTETDSSGYVNHTVVAAAATAPSALPGQGQSKQGQSGYGSSGQGQSGYGSSGHGPSGLGIPEAEQEPAPYELKGSQLDHQRERVEGLDQFAATSGSNTNHSTNTTSNPTSKSTQNTFRDPTETEHGLNQKSPLDVNNTTTKPSDFIAGTSLASPAAFGSYDYPENRLAEPIDSINRDPSNQFDSAYTGQHTAEHSTGGQQHAGQHENQYASQYGKEYQQYANKYANQYDQYDQYGGGADYTGAPPSSSEPYELKSSQLDRPVEKVDGLESANRGTVAGGFLGGSGGGLSSGVVGGTSHTENTRSAAHHHEPYELKSSQLERPVERVDGLDRISTGIPPSTQPAPSPYGQKSSQLDKSGEKTGAFNKSSTGGATYSSPLPDSSPYELKSSELNDPIERVEGLDKIDIRNIPATGVNQPEASKDISTGYPSGIPGSLPFEEKLAGHTSPKQVTDDMLNALGGTNRSYNNSFDTQNYESATENWDGPDDSTQAVLGTGLDDRSTNDIPLSASDRTISKNTNLGADETNTPSKYSAAAFATPTTYPSNAATDLTTGSSGTRGASDNTGGAFSTSATTGKTADSADHTRGLGATETTGLTGTTGSTGAYGTKGTTGSTGAYGTTGSTGLAGTTGSTGSTGAYGTSGTKEPAGTYGTTGYDTTGAKGPTGAYGTAGSTGAYGTSGAKESAGTYGTTGYDTTGRKEPAGAYGTTGSTGTYGASGAKEPAGTYGTTGYDTTGTKEPAGAYGTTGLTGSSGAYGTSTAPPGTYGTLSEHASEPVSEPISSTSADSGAEYKRSAVGTETGGHYPTKSTSATSSPISQSSPYNSTGATTTSAPRKPHQPIDVNTGFPIDEENDAPSSTSSQSSKHRLGSRGPTLRQEGKRPLSHTGIPGSYTQPSTTTPTNERNRNAAVIAAATKASAYAKQDVAAISDPQRHASPRAAGASAGAGAAGAGAAGTAGAEEAAPRRRPKSASWIGGGSAGGGSAGAGTDSNSKLNDNSNEALGGARSSYGEERSSSTQLQRSGTKKESKFKKFLRKLSA